MSKEAEDLRVFLARKQKEKLFSHYYLGFGSLCGQLSSFYEYQDNYLEKIFDLASLTKALVTTPLVLKSLEEKSDLAVQNLSFAEWVGEQSFLFHPKIQKMKIMDLLQHKAGLPPWKNLWINRCSSKGLFAPFNRRHFIERLNHHVGGERPLKGVFYSDLGFILLGLGLELRFGAPLNHLFNKYCKKDLSFQKLSLCFASDLGNKKKTVSTSYCALRKRVLQGEVHDENCAAFAGVSGARRAFWLWRRGSGFFKSFLVHKRGKALACLVAKGEALWLEARKHKTSALFADGKSFGHFGFTGCAFWVDPKTSSFLIFLTNRVKYSRVSPSFACVRRRVFAKVSETMLSL